MAVVNKSVDEIVELEVQKKKVTTFVDWLRVSLRAERLKDQFIADLQEYYAIATTGEVAFS